MTSKIYAGIDCGYRTGGVALIDKSGFAEVHDLPTYSEGGVDITALNEILTSVDIDPNASGVEEGFTPAKR